MYNILIVDDEQEIADLLALYLKNEGYGVYTYYDAAGALQCMKEKILIWRFWTSCCPTATDFPLPNDTGDAQLSHYHADGAG